MESHAFTAELKARLLAEVDLMKTLPRLSAYNVPWGSVRGVPRAAVAICH